MSGTRSVVEAWAKRGQSNWLTLQWHFTWLEQLLKRHLKCRFEANFDCHYWLSTRVKGGNKHEVTKRWCDVNMNFILFHLLIGSENELLVFLYDITCQWSWSLSQCLVQLLNLIQLSDKQHHLLQFAIPKFHISAYELDCQSNFSFNYQPYIVCIDGKDLEWWWAHINPMSMSMREMGLRAWLDILDDHAGA